MVKIRQKQGNQAQGIGSLPETNHFMPALKFDNFGHGGVSMET
jgi:hypothetical protein